MKGVGGGCRLFCLFVCSVCSFCCSLMLFVVVVLLRMGRRHFASLFTNEGQKR